MERAAPLDWSFFHVPLVTSNHLFFAAVAALPILALISQTPASWWVQSGFETYPGTFERIATDRYPLCRPWREPDPGAHQEKGVHVATRFGAVTGGTEANFAVLLPKNAQVTAVYCGMAPEPLLLKDCSVLKCPAAARIQVEDSVFTRGRGLEFSVRQKAVPAGMKANVGFWVFWRDATA